jgi:hypothetical protein
MFRSSPALPIVAVATLLGAPGARPCSIAIDQLATANIIVDGATDLPTNVRLAFAPVGMFEDVRIDAQASDDGVDPDGEGVTVTVEGTGLIGEPALLPRTRYALTAPSLPGPVSFVTGDGPDTAPPEAPLVDVETFATSPSLPYVDSCGGQAELFGATVVELFVDPTPDAVGFFVVDPAAPEPRFGRDFFSFVSADGGTRDVEVFAIDRAGNTSAPTRVTLDFGAAGGCSQGGARALAAPLALLPLLALRRRRQGR